MAKSSATLLAEHWGKRIRSCRGDRTQGWLAQAVGVDQTTISRIERGRYRLSQALMVDIAVALDVADLDDLFAYPPGLLDREKFTRGVA